MKLLFTFFISLSFALSLQAQPETGTTSSMLYTVDAAQSRMSITGGSTVGSWDADVTRINAQFMVDLAALQNGGANGLSLSSFSVPVGQIQSDAGNRMTNNIHKYLEKDKHPEISFTFGDAAISGQNGNTYEVLVNGIINAAGTNHAVQFTSVATLNGDQTIALQGTVDLNFSDFGISRPSAMLGTVRASEEIQIHYNLILTAR